MGYELWGNTPDEYSFMFSEDDLIKRVFLEECYLINGLDTSDVHILNDLYKKELVKSKEIFDIKSFLAEVSKGWFSLVECDNIYVNFCDSIIFNTQTDEFESMTDKYADYTESCVETYNEDGKLVTLRKNDFEYTVTIEINEASKLLVHKSNEEEESLYTVSNSTNFIAVNEDLVLCIKKGKVIRECELSDYRLDKELSGWDMSSGF